MVYCIDNIIFLLFLGSILELCKQIENYQKQSQASRKLPQHENAELFFRFSNSCPFKTRFRQILCPFCYDEYNTLTEYKNHVKLEHTNYDFKFLFQGLKDNLIYADITDLKCTICSQKMTDVDTFMKHLSEDHKKPVRFDARFGVLPIVIDTENHYVCPCCHVIFPELVPARKHIETHFSTFKCYLCGAMFVSNQSLECHTKKANCVELKQCHPNAGKEMKSRVNAQILLQKSTAVPFRVWKKNFQCLLCNVRVKEPQALRIHFAFQHQSYQVQRVFYKKLAYDYLSVDITDLHCKICSEPIPSLEVLMSHLKTIHNEPLDMDSKFGLLPFKMNDGTLWRCTVCTVNEFTDFYSLKKHTAEHFQNYVCDVCGDGFITNRALGMHSKFRHDLPGVKRA